MSILRRLSGARPTVCAFGRAVARVLGLGRSEVLDERTMPAWQLRDLGLRDGRDTVVGRSRDVRGA